MPWASVDLTPYVEQAREQLIEVPSLRVFLAFCAAAVLLLALGRVLTLFTRRK